MKHTPSTPRSSGRRALLLAAVTATAAAGVAPWSVANAQAQAYPSRPVTLIIPWPAGGSTDRHLRALAEIATVPDPDYAIDRLVMNISVDRLDEFDTNVLAGLVVDSISVLPSRTLQSSARSMWARSSIAAKWRRKSRS